jgi:hypothetical protein
MEGILMSSQPTYKFANFQNKPKHMIEVIKEKIKMPQTNERRFIYTCKNGNINGKWYVIDTMNENKEVGNGGFEDMAFRCLHLNKNYYRALTGKELEFKPHLTNDQ